MLQVRGKYAHLARSEAVQRVADEQGFTRSGVSGMTSRAEKTVQGRVELMRYLSEQSAVSASQVHINALVADARLTLARHRSRLLTNVPYYAVYVPDMHIPKQHHAALELAYKVIEDLQNIAYISTLNDGFDFAKLSRWVDRRGIVDIEQDVNNVLSIYKHHVDVLRMVAPLAVFPAIIGNHDVRMFTSETGTGGYVASNLMRELAGVGVLFIDKPDKENLFFVNDGLAWAHGYTARANRVGGARKNYEETRRLVPQNKTLYDLVFGHTHAAMQTTTTHGATVFNAGCLCNLTPDYMRKRPDWQHALVVSKFLPGSTWHDTRLIKIEQRNDHLTALNPFTGREHRVKGTTYP
jgi:predicted phosphodiesterase